MSDLKIQEQELTEFDKSIITAFNLIHPFTTLSDVKKISKIVEDEMRKLGMISKAESKYKIGDRAWHLNDENMPESFIITKVDRDGQEYLYQDVPENCWWWLEEQLHPSREALIEAQIKRWTCLKSEEKSTHSDNMSTVPTIECRHESDGTCRLTNPVMYSCKKCGEFF